MRIEQNSSLNCLEIKINKLKKEKSKLWIIIFLLLISNIGLVIEIWSAELSKNEDDYTYRMVNCIDESENYMRIKFVK